MQTDNKNSRCTGAVLLFSVMKFSVTFTFTTTGTEFGNCTIIYGRPTDDDVENKLAEKL